MALQAVLSAFRQLVLDGVELPEAASERARLFRELFPDLSDPEVDDLAKVSPSRLGIYTTSVFSAEASILKNAFPLTLAAIESSWPPEWGEYSGRALAQRIHKVAPWRGIHSMSLGESLIAFVDQELAPRAPGCPWLREAVTLEQAMLEIRRAPNEPIAPQGEAELDRFSALKVSELLEQEAYVPVLVREVSLSWDLLKARRALLEGGVLLEPERRPQLVLGARPKEYGVQFVALPREGCTILIENRGKRAVLSLLAEAFLASSVEQGTSEEEVFRTFYASLRSLVAAGALVLGPFDTAEARLMNPQ
jgi:hypothetical protein